MRKRVLTGWAVISAALAFGEATPSISGNTYTFDLGADDTYSTPLSGAIAIVKRGSGKLTLTGNNTQTGDITIEGGILGADTPAHFGKPKYVTIKKGAALDFTPSSSSDDSAGNLSSCTRVDVEGTGPDGNGAIRRTSGAYSSANFIANLNLTGDMTYNVGVAHRTYKSIKLNGYKLTKIGGADWVLNGVDVDAADAGGRVASMEIQGGSLIFQGSAKLTGSAANKLIWNNASDSLRFWDYTGHALVWTLDAKKNVRLNTAGDNNKTTSNCWSGPINGSTSVNFEDSIAGTGLKNLSVDGPYCKATSITMWGNKAVVDLHTSITNTGTLNVNGNTLRISGNGKHSFGGNWVINNEGKTDRNVAVELIDAGDVNFPAAKWIYFKGNNTSYVTSMTISNSVLRFPAGSDGQLRLGSAQNGINILYVQDGACVTSKVNLAENASGSSGSNSRNAVYQTGGEMVALWNNNTLETDNAPGAYGYYEISGGSFIDHCFRMGLQGSGAFHQKGGAVNCGVAGTYLTYGGNGLYRMTGGTANLRSNFYLSSANPSSAYSSGTCSAQSLLALSGVTTKMTVAGWVSQEAKSYYNNAIVAVNDGATLACNRFFKSTAAIASSYSPEMHLAVNGGVIMPTQGSDWFDTANHSKDPDSFTIYGKGLTVDTSKSCEYQSTKPSLSELYMPMTKPTGKSVASIALPASVASETKYVGPTAVIVSGTGHGAAAVAEFDSATRRITGITVVAPGFGYDDSTTATIMGPDGKTPITCEVAMANAVTTGGLTKRGAQELRLYGANTYGGETSCEEGSLVFKNDGAYPGGDLRLAGGRIYFDKSASISATIRTSCADLFGGQSFIRVNGNLDLTGSTFEIVDPENLDLYKESGKVTVCSVDSSKKITGMPTLKADYGRFGFFGADSSLRFGYQKGLVIVFR